MLRKLFRPSLLDVFFVVLLLSLTAHRQTLEHLLRDGDTGWHIRTGELILHTGHAPQTDPFSFTRPDQPWMAWEWGADLAFAEAFRWRGLGGVACLAGTLIALAATTMFAFLLRRDYGLWIAIFATLAAVSASSIHFLARPHLFSILFFTLAAGLLAEDRTHNSPLLWIAVPLTALWANLHAGFVAWLATLALLLICCAARRDAAGLRRYGALAALCAVASFANPYGWRLHAHIATYLNSPWILDHVQEFQSPQIRSEGAVVFALLLLGATALSSHADCFEAVLAIAWGFAGLRSARHVPFFAIAAAPVLASGLSRLWTKAASRASRQSASRVIWELGLELGSRARISVLLPVTAAIAMAASPAHLAFPEPDFPIQAVRANVDRLAPTSAAPRVFTSDQWADYLIFQLYPRQKVFFDGRSDFFGPELGADYRSLQGAEPNWRGLLARYGFQAALLPRDWPLASVLDREPGWRIVYRDSVAVLFVKESAA